MRLVSVQSVIELTQQMEKLRLFIGREGAKFVDDAIFVAGNHRSKHIATRFRRKESIAATVLLALDQATPLHPIEQLADVSLRYQERVSQFLLGHAFAGTDVSQHVKLSQTEPAAAQLIS